MTHGKFDPWIVFNLDITLQRWFLWEPTIYVNAHDDLNLHISNMHRTQTHILFDTAQFGITVTL